MRRLWARVLNTLAAMALGPGTSALTPTMIDPPRLPARAATVRQQFDRRATRFAQHDAVVREVERRLLDRLDAIRIEPAHVVDIGCGAGHSRALLAARYARADWLGIDASTAMLAQGRPTARGWLARWTAPRAALGARICADAQALPLADRSVDLLVSNLMLHWHPAPHEVFPQWLRVLRPEGLVLFSCFGPDTLAELRAACGEVLPAARPMHFIDMHDFGDMMVAAGFATPVMDVERLTLTYPSADALLAEVRALGGNPRDDRAHGLPGSRRARQLHAQLESQRTDDGRIALTFEVAYGHAWRPAQDRGESVVSLDALRARLPSRR